MKKLFAGLLAIALYCTAFAQTTAKIDFANFSPLKSVGTLPDEVEMTGKDFIESSRNSVMKGGNKKDKKAKAQFLLESSYAIKELFISGRVLYNDPISQYVEKVRLEVTTSDLKLQGETKMFVIKSSVVNAFATNQGYIFITTGLLSQLENEAQLAFIICHELMHYKRKHVLKGYVENEKIERGDGAYRKSSIDKKYLAKSNYSKEHESEADGMGFDLFVLTDYNVDGANGTFDILKYSELPFEEIEFSPKSLLETEHLKMPVDYIKEDVGTPEGEDEEKDDKYSTHPNLKTRRDDILDKVASMDAKEKAKTRRLFVVSEETFNYVRKLARYDLCHTNLISRNYDKAFYEAYCLLQEDPDNLYLKKVILKSLYGLTKYKNGSRFKEVSLKSTKVEGESQRLNFLLEKFEKNELNVVALNYAWRLKKSLKSEDVEVNLITEDIFYDMVKLHYPSRSKFSTEARTTPVDTARTATVEPEAKKTTKNKREEEDEEETKTTKSASKSKSKTKSTSESRTSKLKKKKKIDEKTYFVTYAFVDLLKDPDFVDTYDRLSKQTKKDKSEEKKEVSRRKSFKKKNKIEESEEDDDEDNQYLIEEKEVAKKYNYKWDCYALGVDKVLFLNPFYLKIDERKKAPVLYAGSDEAQKKFNDNISKTASDVNLNVEVLDKKQFNASSVEGYNDMGVLIDWLDERIDHKKLKILPTDYLQVDAISKKYDTEYIGLIGAINYVEKKRGIGLAIAISVMLPVYSWLFTFPYLFTKSTHTYVYTIVFNMRTGLTEMVNIGNASLGDKQDVVGSFLYDHLKQISRGNQNKNN